MSKRKPSESVENQFNGSIDGNVAPHGNIFVGLSGGQATILVVAAVLSFTVAALVFAHFDASLHQPQPPVSESPSPADLKSSITYRQDGGESVSDYIPTESEYSKYLDTLQGQTRDASYVSFWSRAHLVRVRDAYKLSITNAGGTLATIEDIKPIIVKREPPLTAAWYEPLGGAAPVEGTIASLDLDEHYPTLKTSAGGLFIQQSVPLKAGDTFNITVKPSANASYCDYYFQVTYIANGVQKTYAIKDDNYLVKNATKDFELSAASPLSKYKVVFKAHGFGYVENFN
ncbi:hypothetical protein ABUW04_09385 [Streptacidiphilus sp. N1-10]|uniref:Uncharacterized protein n=1 Tax=Streptacidiphilus jeojiensis TaxID=3229225 RepID=A0ABV6XJP5_9ACTN